MRRHFAVLVKTMQGELSIVQPGTMVLNEKFHLTFYNSPSTICQLKGGAWGVFVNVCDDLMCDI